MKKKREDEMEKSIFKERQEEGKSLFEMRCDYVGNIFHDERIKSAEVTSDNKYIVSVSDKTIGVWSVSDKTLFHRFEEAYSLNSPLVVTSDSKYIISGSGAKTIGVWSIADKALFHRFERAHQDSITSVEVTNDSKFIISVSNDKTIGVWNIAEKKFLIDLKDTF